MCFSHEKLLQEWTNLRECAFPDEHKVPRAVTYIRFLRPYSSSIEKVIALNVFFIFDDFAISSHDENLLVLFLMGNVGVDRKARLIPDQNASRRQYMGE